MTATEAARILMLHRDHVTELARSGEIKAAKVGRAWCFDETDVLRWKAERPARKPQDHPWRHGMVLGQAELEMQEVFDVEHEAEGVQ